MSITLDNQPVNLAGRILDALADAAGRVVHRIRRRMEINRNRRVLRELPDHILKDIGINRGDINDLTDNQHPGRDTRWRAAERLSLRGRGL